MIVSSHKQWWRFTAHATNAPRHGRETTSSWGQSPTPETWKCYTLVRDLKRLPLRLADCHYSRVQVERAGGRSLLLQVRPTPVPVAVTPTSPSMCYVPRGGIPVHRYFMSLRSGFLFHRTDIPRGALHRQFVIRKK